MKKLFLFLILNSYFLILNIFSPVFAQVPPIFPTLPPVIPHPIFTVDLGNISGLGPLGTIIEKLLKGSTDVTPASNMFTLFLSAVIGIVTIVAGIWFFIKILLAGFSYISSGGDKNKIQESQHTIINSLIGIVIVVGAYALTSLLGKILGLDILNLGGILIKISPFAK